MTPWTTKMLPELCRPKQWPTLAKKDFAPTGYPVYGANGKIGFAAHFTHERPTILIGCRGSCGTIHVSEAMSYANGNAMALDDLDTSQIRLPWLAHFLLYRGFSDVVTGTSQPQITQQGLARVEVPVPPLPEQDRIVELIDEADALRNLRAEADERTGMLVAALFYEAFGDGRSFASVPLIDLVDRERGISYGVVQRGNHYPDGVPLLRIADFARNSFNPKNPVSVDPIISAQYKRTLLQGGELAVSIRGTVGRVAIVPPEAAGWNVAREVAVVPLLPEVCRPFIQAYMLGATAQDFMISEVRGIAQRGINLEDLRRLPIPQPPISFQILFADRVKEIRLLQREQEESRRRLDHLSQSMLHSAFEGEM